MADRPKGNESQGWMDNMPRLKSQLSYARNQADKLPLKPMVFHGTPLEMFNEVQLQKIMAWGMDSLEEERRRHLATLDLLDAKKKESNADLWLPPEKPQQKPSFEGRPTLQLWHGHYWENAMSMLKAIEATDGALFQSFQALDSIPINAPYAILYWHTEEIFVEELT